jgi:nicotinamidase-related amidase
MILAYCKHDSLNLESPLRQGQIWNEIKELVKPLENEKIFVKHVNSCFIGTDLEKWLREMKAEEIFICGITTQYCVSSTARMAGNLGFTNYVIEDATVAFEISGYNGDYINAETVQRVNLASLYGEFSGILKTRDILDLPVVD